MAEVERTIYDYAGFWRRVLAFLIDGIVVAFVAQGVIGILEPLIGGTDHAMFMNFDGGTRTMEYGPGGVPKHYSNNGPKFEANFGFRSWASFAIFLAVSWLYEAVLQSSKLQATLGKLALGMRVVDTKGRRIGFAQATGRFFASLLSWLLGCIGYLMVAWSAHKQALHDCMAGTLVVRRVSAASVELPLPGPLPE